MYRQSEKNSLSINTSSTCPHNMVDFGPLADENYSLVWGTPAYFNGFRVLAALLRWHWPTFLVSSCFFLLFYFSRLISAIGDWMLPYFHTWCGLSANLECRSEMCCTWLTEHTGRKNDAKNRHLGTIPQPCRAISSQLRHISTI